MDDDEYEELHRPHPEHHDHIRRQLKTQLRYRVRSGEPLDLVDHGVRPRLDLPQAEYYAFPGAHTITAYPKGTLRKDIYDRRKAEEVARVEAEMKVTLPPPTPKPSKADLVPEEMLDDEPATSEPAPSIDIIKPKRVFGRRRK